uniref:Uncharacterized protein n=2 Tax=Lygus hesperus TaxID=30085 RepID=A0A0K8SDC0_LYGHE
MSRKNKDSRGVQEGVVGRYVKKDTPPEIPIINVWTSEPMKKLPRRSVTENPMSQGNATAQKFNPNRIAQSMTTIGHEGKYTPSASVPDLAQRFASLGVGGGEGPSNVQPGQYSPQPAAMVPMMNASYRIPHGSSQYSLDKVGHGVRYDQPRAYNSIAAYHPQVVYRDHIVEWLPPTSHSQPNVAQAQEMDLMLPPGWSVDFTLRGASITSITTLKLPIGVIPWRKKASPQVGRESTVQNSELITSTTSPERLNTSIPVLSTSINRKCRWSCPTLLLVLPGTPISIPTAPWFQPILI